MLCNVCDVCDVCNACNVRNVRNVRNVTINTTSALTGWDDTIGQLGMEMDSIG